MQHPKEMQVVRFSMLVLFSALMVVYLLLYQIKGTQIASNLSDTWDISSQPSDLSGSDAKISDLLLETDASDLTWDTTSNSSGKTVSTTTSLFGNLPSWTGSTTTKAESIKLLSGTKLRYGLVDSIEKLGISYQYALKDDQSIYYVYLGKDNKLDIESIVKKLGGSVKTILREDEIVKNNLFWDKVSYINLPEYKDKKVIMLVTIDGADWLLQLDYATYYSSKSYLKNLFIQ